jgi:nucleoside-diphosphate-sugar epimerase
VPLDVPSLAASVLEAEGNARRFAETGGNAVVLRFALFYAPDSMHTHEAVRMARRRIAATVGHPDGYVSSIHGDDAGAAVAAALDAPTGTYNVGDDEPMTRREHFTALADALHVAPPRFPGATVGRLVRSKADILMRSQRIANERFRKTTGWAPRYPSVREGWPAVVADLDEDGHHA